MQRGLMLLCVFVSLRTMHAKHRCIQSFVNCVPETPELVSDSAICCQKGICCPVARVLSIEGLTPERMKEKKFPVGALDWRERKEFMSDVIYLTQRAGDAALFGQCSLIDHFRPFPIAKVAESGKFDCENEESVTRCILGSNNCPDGMFATVAESAGYHMLPRAFTGSLRNRDILVLQSHSYNDGTSPLSQIMCADRHAQFSNQQLLEAFADIGAPDRKILIVMACNGFGKYNTKAMVNPIPGMVPVPDNETEFDPNAVYVVAPSPGHAGLYAIWESMRYKLNSLRKMKKALSFYNGVLNTAMSTRYTMYKYTPPAPFSPKPYCTCLCGKLPLASPTV